MLKYAFFHILETLFLSFLMPSSIPKIDKNRTLHSISINIFSRAVLEGVQMTCYLGGVWIMCHPEWVGMKCVELKDINETSLTDNVQPNIKVNINTN